VTIVVAHGGGDSFLARFLGVLVGVIKRDSDERGTIFNGRPFLRIISGLIFELSGHEPGDIAVHK
jgi:CCR4-NOT transcription complex subunit 1